MPSSWAKTLTVPSGNMPSAASGRAEAVDDFVDCAVAARGNDHGITFGNGARGQQFRVARALCRGQDDIGSGFRLKKLAEAPGFLTARSRVENDEYFVHCWMADILGDNS